MTNNLLEQLAEQSVPTRPPELDRRVHERINGRLLVVHLSETFLLALPYAFFHFTKALAGSVVFSLTGRFPQEGDDHATRNPEKDN